LPCSANFGGLLADHSSSLWAVEKIVTAHLEEIIVRGTGPAHLDMPDGLVQSQSPAPVKISHGDQRGTADSDGAMEIDVMAGSEEFGEGSHGIREHATLIPVIKIPHGYPVCFDLEALVGLLQNTPMEAPFPKILIALEAEESRNARALSELFDIRNPLRTGSHVELRKHLIEVDHPPSSPTSAIEQSSLAHGSITV
jgi:hypothetical protein